jgi:hypothetical protein
MPQYTLSLGIWIVPIFVLWIFFVKKRLLTPEKIFALIITVVVCAAVGIILDLFFGLKFFRFPNADMIIGCKIRGIPIEEFVFYITGFWFIAFLYVFCDEWFLLKYNKPDEEYASYRRGLGRTVFVHKKSIVQAVLLVLLGIVIKRLLNRHGPVLPGYYIFLVIVAYMPAIFFFKVTKPFVNWQGYVVTLLTTVLISIIWEVTLALPRGYWNYQRDHMLGIFAKSWSDLPIEAVTVWICSSLAILVYEYVKIRFFTDTPSVPLHGQLLKWGREWRTVPGSGPNNRGTAVMPLNRL